MATKKKDIPKLTDFIGKGEVEQARLTPEQRGILMDSPESTEKNDVSRRNQFIKNGKAEEPSEANPGANSDATPKTKRERFTVNLSSDLIEWARRAVVFTPGQSLSGLVEDALTRELECLEMEQGKPFPSTMAKPKRGRPITLNKA